MPLSVYHKAALLVLIFALAVMIETNDKIYSLRDKKLSQDDIEKLILTPNYNDLKVIDLWGNRLSKPALNVLLKNLPKGLKTMNIVDNNLGVKGAKSIAKHIGNVKELERLNLQYTKLGPKGLEELLTADLSKINEINLRENELGFEGAKLLSQANLERLSGLNVSYNDFGDEGVSTIMQNGMANNLKKLHVGDNDLKSKGIEAIAEQCSNLEVLNLERNWCGPEGAIALAKSTAPIVDLDLFWNDITEKGLLFCIKTFKKLEKVSLRNNKLGDDGAIVLAEHMAETILNLDIEDNEIGSVGMSAIASSKGMVNLSHLHIRGNQLDYDCAASLLLSKNIRSTAKEWLVKQLQWFITKDELRNIGNRLNLNLNNVNDDELTEAFSYELSKLK